MYRTLALAAALGALAVPAAADSVVKVNIAGLDANAARAKIVKAAQSACRIELRDEPSFDQYYELPVCIGDAVTSARPDDRHLASR
jgi:hypothetical protein